MMRPRKIITIVLIFTLLMGIGIIPISFGQITVDDSTFPLEQGESIRWETTNATESPYTGFPYIRFTVNDVYNDTWSDGPNCLIVNYTLAFYHNFVWIYEKENTFYLAYNFSQNYLNWSEIAYLDALPLIVPTPVDLTLIGDALESSGPLNYSFSDSTLLLDYRNTTTVEITYNSHGISTIIEKITNKTTIFRWELVKSEVVVVVPFSNYYLLAILIASISLIRVKLKKLKITSE
jgi:hypothetical protein